MMVILGGLIESARDSTAISVSPVDPYTGREGEYYDREMLKTLSDNSASPTANGGASSSPPSPSATTASTAPSSPAHPACSTSHTTIDRELLDRAVTIAEKKGT